MLFDRHYNSLVPYRKSELNMYAIQVDDICKLGYVEQAGANIIIRPHNHSYLVEVVPIAEGETISDHIVGRICYMEWKDLVTTL